MTCIQCNQPSTSTVCRACEKANAAVMQRLPPKPAPVTWDADDGGPGQDYNSAAQDLMDPF